MVCTVWIILTIPSLVNTCAQVIGEKMMGAFAHYLDRSNVKGRKEAEFG